MLNKEIVTTQPQIPTQNQIATGGSGSPHSPYFRKRRAVEQVKKTNEDLIEQAHQQLLSYVDTIDDEVKNVVKGYQAQFLQAYRRHFMKVREEMKQIGKRTQTAMEDNRQYVFKIQTLQKQVALFRQESLKLSEQNNKLCQQIKHLKYTIKELEKQNQNTKQQLAKVIKQNKDAAVVIESISHINPSQNNTKSFQFSSPVNTLNERSFAISHRNYQRRINLGLESLKSSTSKSNRQNHVSASKNEVNLNQFSKTIDCKTNHQSKQVQQQRKTTNERFSKSRQNTKKIVREEVRRLRSQQLTKNNEYQGIFSQCVENVRKQVLRRNKMTGLNFYKNKGPIDFAQFRRIDYHLLLFQFLSNETILKAFYNLLFRNQVS